MIIDDHRLGLKVLGQRADLGRRTLDLILVIDISKLSVVCFKSQFSEPLSYGLNRSYRAYDQKEAERCVTHDCADLFHVVPIQLLLNRSLCFSGHHRDSIIKTRLVCGRVIR